MAISTEVTTFGDLSPCYTTTITVNTGATVSGAADFGRLRLYGLVCPAVIDGTTVAFYTNVAGTAYVAMYDNLGAALTSAITTSGYMALDPTKFSGVNRIKITCGTTQAQTGVFTLVMKA